ncbi:sensor histidine kinase [Gilvimarinus polysaccharolyticus]|uniref:sensor histidine kinase n=1 Tax=Gilvimarinus polysaccharolyticus TaxID=863921 RepID=UPI0006732E41|nr:ATP-binding protein [Gilvimarinus polysaccharolyticus]
MGKFLNRGSTLSSDHIGRRLLFAIVLFSSLVTLLATVFQLFIDFQRDIGQIKTRLDDVQSSYLASISASLWNLDPSHLKLQMEGIRQLPDVEAVAIYEDPADIAEPLTIVLGEFTQQRAINRDYAITHHAADGERHIGTLRVQASLNGVYSRLWEKLVIILFTQGIKTFLVSLFILFIVYRLITTHLVRIAQYVNQFDVADSPEPLQLERRNHNHHDELDQVVGAFNRLSDNLTQAYDRMRQANDALARDVLARRKAEEEVRYLNTILEDRVKQRTSELQAANDELASFCYSVSHDLRAPLRRIEGFRRMLEDDCNELLPDQSQHYLGRIEAGTLEMSEMIDSFLHLSRATLGELHREPIDVTQQAQQLFTVLREREPERDICLVVQPNLQAWADKRFFTMLITNLMENAIKYTRPKAHAQIEIGQCLYQGQSVFYIRDNGAGFDMNYAERLFAPFSRLHKAEEFEGTGIGLATVQRIISRHGGRIWAESTPNKGATFYFCFKESTKDDEQRDNTVGRG